MVSWRDHVFRDRPHLDAVDSKGDYRKATAVTQSTAGKQEMPHIMWWQLREGISPEDLEMRSFGYADCAIESYKKYKRQKEAGATNADNKFMAAIPSPFNMLNSATAPWDRMLVEPTYEAQMRREIDRIAAAISHDGLAI